jgi:sortase A
VFAPGDYKYIFIQLDKLEVGDTIYANYKGKRYTYSVTKKEVVKPTEVNKLVYPTDKPVMTLITCTPIGTALNRLLVTAEQVYPDPSSASAAPEASSSAADPSASR